ncbi:hypothetical protein [Rosenbergiella epipactidis]|uniref:hypothetical protein n=1 Tax=Rosenbergiella epipactidis TaxID=1544694 RepID=UPI001F4EDA44|nr:hypothetical protein [Rosenbergiella epipactidis]
MELYQEEILSKYSKNRLRLLQDEKNKLINNYYSLYDVDSEKNPALKVLIADIRAMCGGHSFSIEELCSGDEVEPKRVVDGLRYFIELICYKHRAENSHCRRFVSAIVSHVSNGDDYTAYSMYTVLASATTGLRHSINAPSILGANGGRPKNRHRDEAEHYAKLKWEQIPGASISVVSTAVKFHLENQYTDAPKLPTIKNWLKKIKPS